MVHVADRAHVAIGLEAGELLFGHGTPVVIELSCWCLHDSRHRESPFGARSRFRSGLIRLSGETFGQAQSRSAADEGISPPVISTDARRDCRILDAWVAALRKDGRT